LIHLFTETGTGNDRYLLTQQPLVRMVHWRIKFQAEHHLFPDICHIHYPSISPIVERTAREYGVPYNENKTFFNAIGSHIRMLRTLEKNA
jgi:linoleoyl-CoA desaturase